ncbi:MAG: hypothetical protein OXE57_22490 [Alphaproteobacteria bacterium]|nr:hypothetical protein [Alphaproteobacteria bacterium]
MRFEGRAASRIEAAVWDRLLRRPPGVLHRYPAGDLAMRGMTFQDLRDAVQGGVANSVLSVIFLLPAFVVLFFFDAMLGGIALGFSTVSLLVTTALGLRQILPHGRTIRAVRQVAGRLSQIIHGIAKLRVDSAEGSAFAVWARAYREQKRAELDLGALEGHLQAFAAALPFAAGAVLLFATVVLDRQTIPVGNFLVIYAVFMAFQAAVARLGDSVGAMAAMLPAFEQVRPFLTQPRSRLQTANPSSVWAGTSCSITSPSATAPTARRSSTMSQSMHVPASSSPLPASRAPGRAPSSGLRSASSSLPAAPCTLTVAMSGT